MTTCQVATSVSCARCSSRPSRWSWMIIGMILTCLLIFAVEAATNGNDALGRHDVGPKVRLVRCQSAEALEPQECQSNQVQVLQQGSRQPASLACLYIIVQALIAKSVVVSTMEWLLAAFAKHSHGSVPFVLVVPLLDITLDLIAESVCFDLHVSQVKAAIGFLRGKFVVLSKQHAVQIYEILQDISCISHRRSA